MSMRIKNQDVRDDRANLQRLFDSATADNQRAVEDRDSTILESKSSRNPEQLQLQPKWLRKLVDSS